MNIISDLVTGAASGILDGFKGIISTFVADPTEKLKALQAVEALKIQHEEAMQKLVSDLEIARLKDVDSARNMQIEALKQEDKFSKRFIYYLTIGIVLLAFGFDYCIFFIHYPIENRDMINLVAGFINGTALSSILSFFYGSSQSSKTKEDTINKMANK